MLEFACTARGQLMEVTALSQHMVQAIKGKRKVKVVRQSSLEPLTERLLKVCGPYQDHNGHVGPVRILVDVQLPALLGAYESNLGSVHTV